MPGRPTLIVGDRWPVLRFPVAGELSEADERIAVAAMRTGRQVRWNRRLARNWLRPWVGCSADEDSSVLWADVIGAVQAAPDLEPAFVKLVDIELGWVWNLLRDLQDVRTPAQRYLLWGLALDGAYLIADTCGTVHVLRSFRRRSDPVDD